jgi:putative molybdopterin biosynthesis protein
MIRIPQNSEGFNAGDTAPVELYKTAREIRETSVIIGSHDLTLDVLANFLRRKFPEATLHRLMSEAWAG